MAKTVFKAEFGSGRHLIVSDEQVLEKSWTYFNQEETNKRTRNSTWSSEDKSSIWAEKETENPKKKTCSWDEDAFEPALVSLEDICGSQNGKNTSLFEAYHDSQLDIFPILTGNPHHVNLTP